MPSNAASNAQKISPARRFNPTRTNRIRAAAVASTALLASTIAPAGLTVATAAPTSTGNTLLQAQDAQSSRSLQISSTSELSDGDTVTVTGAGYPAGAKIYLAQTIEQPTSGYPSTYGSAAKVTVSPDGSFSQEMQVSPTFKDVDCTQTQCYIASFSAFPNLADRSNDQWVPISFAGAAAKLGTEGNSSPNSDESSGKGLLGDLAPSWWPDSPSLKLPNGIVPTGAPTGDSTKAPAEHPHNGSDSSEPSSAESSPKNDTGASTSASGASVSLSKTTGLNPNGDTIRVTGKGFKTSGNGIYVGIAQNDQMDVTSADSFGPDTKYVSASRGNLAADGSFSVDLPVSAVFGKADCLANACSVYTIAAHGSQDRSQDTATAVSFAGGVEKQEATLPAGGNSGNGSSASSAGAPGAPSGSAGGRGSGQSSSGSRGGGKSSDSSAGPVSVSLSTTTIQPSGVTPITVSGSGFKTTGNGIYVAVGEKGKFSTTNADAFATAAYVRTSDMSADGSFSTTLQVEAVTAAANCLDNDCAVFTMAAHGSSDRSQDTVTDLSVGGSAQEIASAKKGAAKKQADAKAKAQSSGKKSSSKASGKATAGSKNSATSAEDAQTEQATATSAISPLGALGIGALGAVLGAGIFGAGMWFGRKRPAGDNSADRS